MAEHLAISPHMTRLPEHDAILATFIGQAHIAGTGPEGKTCRECSLWGVKCTKNKVWGIHSPGHFSTGNKLRGGQLKNGGCHKEIRGKASRRFPHHAPACRFFEASENPPAAQIEARADK